MAQQKLDTILAFKALSLAQGHSGPDKAVGAALLDHYNRKTGRCDPSLQCISELVGVSERTVMRSVERLVHQSLFVKIRHGGLGHRNHYEPNWPRYREIESQWSARRSARSLRLRGQHLSPPQRQPVTSIVTGPSTKPVPIIH